LVVCAGAGGHRAPVAQEDALQGLVIGVAEALAKNAFEAADRFMRERWKIL
jgi:hypothetical protein